MAYEDLYEHERPYAMSYTVESSYATLGGVLDTMEAMATTWDDARLARTIPAISAWSPAQQIIHTMRATGAMLKAIEFIRLGRGPVTSEGEPNRIGHMVLDAGRMRRGKAASPDRFIPDDAPPREDILASIARCRKRYDGLGDQLGELEGYANRMAHPFLGNLNAMEWLRNASVHAEHHLRIIEDIDAA